MENYGKGFIKIHWLEAEKLTFINLGVANKCVICEKFRNTQIQVLQVVVIYIYKAVCPLLRNHPCKEFWPPFFTFFSIFPIFSKIIQYFSKIFSDFQKYFPIFKKYFPFFKNIFQFFKNIFNFFKNIFDFFQKSEKNTKFYLKIIQIK